MPYVRVGHQAQPMACKQLLTVTLLITQPEFFSALSIFGAMSRAISGSVNLLVIAHTPLS
jgi:hypothetical protein